VLEERLVLMAPARRLRFALVDGVLTGVAGKRPIRVLDAGCGDGLLSLAIAKRHPDWTVLGVDIRDDMLDGARLRARGRSLENVGFRQGDLTEPMPESEFDAVLAIECLSEIPDDERALRMMVTALGPGGVLVVHVPDSEWVPVLPGSAATWREQVRQGYSPEQISTTLLGLGLSRVEVRPTYRSLVAGAQEIRDRVKGANLLVRMALFPLLATVVWLERLGLSWGRPNAMLALARRSDPE
jgi:trans-aconitate methyltransferase